MAKNRVDERVEFIRSMMTYEIFTIVRQTQSYRFCKPYLNCKLECVFRDNCSKLFGNSRIPHLDFEEADILFEKYPELKIIS